MATMIWARANFGNAHFRHQSLEFLAPWAIYQLTCFPEKGYVFAMKSIGKTRGELSFLDKIFTR